MLKTNERKQMKKEIKITEDKETMGYLYLCVEYRNSNGKNCKLIRRRSDNRGTCGLTGCNTNQNVALYIDDKLINRGLYSSSITNNSNRVNIHNQLLSQLLNK